MGIIVGRRALDLLDSLGSIDLIQSNHERLLDFVFQDHNKLKNITRKYGSGIQKAIEKLTVAQQYYLINQPSERQLLIDGCKFFLCHGSPFKNDVYIHNMLL